MVRDRGYDGQQMTPNIVGKDQEIIEKIIG